MIVHRLTVVGQDDLVAAAQSNKCPSPLFTPHSSPTTTFSLFPTTSPSVSARVRHKAQETVMGFIGRLGKPRVRPKQANELRQLVKRGVDFSSHRSNILPDKRKKKRPLETKEEVAYWLRKSDEKASEKQFFVRPAPRPSRPFRTLPPRLVPAGALLYIVPAFLGGYNFIFIP